ncbi:MAG TPA: hypothetical protein VF837_05615 [Patescibacteria group bacterium]
MKKVAKEFKETEEPGGRDDPGVVSKVKEKVVRIFNLSEDVWPFIKGMGSDTARTAEIEENAELADRDLFTEAKESELTFVCPRPIDPAFVDYFQKLCHVRDIKILNPKNHTGKICKDILEDKELLNELVDIANGAKKLTLVSYSASPNFLRLVRKLRKMGLTIYTPITPEEQFAWTVNFYGSKSGIRQFAQKSGVVEPDFKMPDGLVCSGVFDTAKIAANKYIKEGGVVIKTNKGHSGAGVLIYRKGDLPVSFRACERVIKRDLKKDLYWSKFPVVVESLVKPDMKIGGGFPNAEFIIRKNGSIELLYYCGMRVDDKGIFKGVEISESALPKRVAARIVDTGYYIGEQYAKEGYRGYFDIDFIAGKDGEIYVNESNVRLTGGTHVYRAAQELFGSDFMRKTYVLSHNCYPIPNKKKYTFTKLYEKLKPVIFNKKTKEGVVIASASLLAQNKLAYIIFGKNKKRALGIEEKMENLILK